MSTVDAGTQRAPSPGRSSRPRRATGVVYGVVGVLGELLITLGVLLLGFLVWQLWWTDVEGNAAQAQVVREMGFAPAPTPAAADGPLVAEPRRDEPPVVDEPATGTAFAQIVVPRWDGEPERPVTQGTSRAVLDSVGIGHYEGTAMPGGVGNFAVAGHRVTYGKPFNRVEELRPGDPIVVRTTDTWYVYTVTSTQVVMPRDVDVIAPVPGRPDETPTERFITLTTCHPMFSARERYVVHGVLDHWAPVSSGTPAVLLG